LVTVLLLCLLVPNIFSMLSWFFHDLISQEKNCQS
jgi:hypothetical protein